MELFKKSVIILEASIACGKSTLGRSMELSLSAMGYKALYLPEFFDKDLLDHYLDNKKTQAYAIQIIMIRERIKLFEEAHRRIVSDGYDFVIIDRGLIGDLCFAKMQYDDEFINLKEYNIYRNISKKTFLPYKTEINHFLIYMKCEPKICMERIKIRGIQSEVDNYKIEDIEKLNKYHDLLIGYMADDVNNLSLIHI